MSSSDCQYHDDSVESTSLCSIEEMQSASESAGWDIRYTQIEPGGDVNAHSFVAECGNVLLMDESIDRRVEVIGATPADHISVLVPCGESKGWLNGHFVDHSNIMLYRAGAETHLVTHNASRFLSMHIPPDLLAESNFTTERQCATDLQQQFKLLDCGSRASNELRQVMYQAIHQQGTLREQQARLVSLTNCIHSCLRDADPESVLGRQCRARSALQTISYARDYIHANLHEPMSMSEIAVAAAASISKLERVFQHQLGLTPSQYIRAHRLAAARESLKSSSPDRQQIATIAMDCGFTHLGRFSRFYRNQFGEAPSATLATR